MQKEQPMSLDTFNGFIDSVGYEKSNEYIKEVMKMFDWYLS